MHSAPVPPRHRVSPQATRALALASSSGTTGHHRYPRRVPRLPSWEASRSARMRRATAWSAGRTWPFDSRKFKIHLTHEYVAAPLGDCAPPGSARGVAGTSRWILSSACRRPARGVDGREEWEDGASSEDDERGPAGGARRAEMCRKTLDFLVSATILQSNCKRAPRSRAVLALRDQAPSGINLEP